MYKPHDNKAFLCRSLVPILQCIPPVPVVMSMKDTYAICVILARVNSFDLVFGISGVVGKQHCFFVSELSREIRNTFLKLLDLLENYPQHCMVAFPIDSVSCLFRARINIPVKVLCSSRAIKPRLVTKRRIVFGSKNKRHLSKRFSIRHLNARACFLVLLRGTLQNLKQMQNSVNGAGRFSFLTALDFIDIVTALFEVNVVPCDVFVFRAIFQNPAECSTSIITSCEAHVNVVFQYFF